METNAILDRLCAEFDSPKDHLQAAMELLLAGAPPAYVARFARAKVGGMNEERLAGIADRLHLLGELEQRKESVLQQAAERGRDVAELRAQIASCFDQDTIDDLYQSLRPRRRTAAMQMEEKGLLPLALAVQHRQLGEQGLQEAAAGYLNEQEGLPTVESVLEGVARILAEKIVLDPATRARCRDELRRGVLRAKATNPGKGGAERYQQFFEFAEPIHRISAGRMLALRRAEREKILELELDLPDQAHRALLRSIHAPDLAADSPLIEFYDVVFDLAWQTGLRDGCGRDVRRRLKEKADREAVRTYARNLRSQLMAPPLGHKKALALRNSSKTVWLALLGEDGSVLQHKTLHADGEGQHEEMLAAIVELIRAEKPAAIALPHGKRQAAAEKLVDALRSRLTAEELPMLVPVDEAASAIFATSAAGRRSMPGVEVGVRAAISLGRRLQDPLRELLGMDFRTLGLGQTLDDVHQGMLQRELHAVVSSCVGEVGVDLNTADSNLLAHVPGVGPERAKAILDHKKKLGGYQSRAQLAEVEGIGDKAAWFAGFLYVEGGQEALDRTAVHPHDYEIARDIAKSKDQPVEALFGQDLRDVDVTAFTNDERSRERVLEVVFALRDAGKDARGELSATTNVGVTSIADLRLDMELRGRVANLTEFGAFVDLGIGQDGLVHISQIPPYRLRDPQQMLRVGEVITVWVANVDEKTRKISLSMHKPRHLAEGRQPTLGERMERGKRPARPPRGERRQRSEPAAPTLSRAARAPESRRGQRRSAPVTAEGKPEREHRDGPGEGAPREGGPRRFGGGDRRPRDDRGERPRGGGSRVFTIESGRSAQEATGHRGELTSLASLKNLLGKPAEPTAAPEPKKDEPSS